jgi:hypothetical protein
MTNTVKICGVIDPTDKASGLGLEIWIDDRQIFNQDLVLESHTFTCELDDVDGNHELRFILKNKTQQHTIVDDQGNIVKDSCVVISNLTFDEISLGHILTEKAVYLHNFNGSGPETQDKFYGQIGCNGTVSLKFSTPMYLWLLENM